MNAAFALIPFVLVRIIYFRWLNIEGYQRAQQFAPLEVGKQTYYVFYQMAQILLLIFPFFIQINLSSVLNGVGILLYSAGLIMIGASILVFSKPSKEGFIQSGIYRYSRHPMYVGYFFFYLGLGLWMQSIIYLTTLIFFQIFTHQIILAEEKWCLENFGQAYMNYQKKVRRFV